MVIVDNWQRVGLLRSSWITYSWWVRIEFVSGCFWDLHHTAYWIAYIFPFLRSMFHTLGPYKDRLQKAKKAVPLYTNPKLKPSDFSMPQQWRVLWLRLSQWVTSNSILTVCDFIPNLQHKMALTPIEGFESSLLATNSFDTGTASSYRPSFTGSTKFAPRNLSKPCTSLIRSHVLTTWKPFDHKGLGFQEHLDRLGPIGGQRCEYLHDAQTIDTLYCSINYDDMVGSLFPKLLWFPIWKILEKFCKGST